MNTTPINSNSAKNDTYDMPQERYHEYMLRMLKEMDDYQKIKVSDTNLVPKM